MEMGISTFVLVPIDRRKKMLRWGLISKWMKVKRTQREEEAAVIAGGGQVRSSKC